MCNEQVLNFARSVLKPEDIEDRRVLDVGSYDYNGSFRPIAAKLHPREYIGVDLTPGPGVDEVCGADDLVEHFGAESFDCVLCTEMLEHVVDWRSAIWNLKSVLRPGGTLVVTTRSRGFQFHGYPGDYWRYELHDFRLIFADMSIETLRSDSPGSPGVFLRARRTGSPLTTVDLSAVALYSIVRRRRSINATAVDVYAARAMTTGKRAAGSVTPPPIKRAVRSAVNAITR